MAVIGVCEDDQELRATLVRAVNAGGDDVVVARSGRHAVDLFPSLSPDVVVLDIGLPDSDGRDVCLALRAAGLHAPVLFLTARDGIHDKIAGFEAGGDDYLTKPFAMVELLARIEALARRAPVEVIVGPLHLDPGTYTVSDGTFAARLSPTEFRLMAKLLARPGQIVRRQALLAAGWPMGAMVSENTLDSYIGRLRRKLAELPSVQESIQTVRAVGYAWR